MEKFRCPTCLTLLEGGEQRCPACNSRLRKRGRPIVLGDASRLTSRALFPFERDLRERVEASNAADPPWHRPHVSVEGAASGAELPEAVAMPEALEALLAFEATIVTEAPKPPQPPRIIDLTTETLLEPTATRPPVDIDLTGQMRSFSAVPPQVDTSPPGLLTRFRAASEE